jgi:hypothetical protein
MEIAGVRIVTISEDLPVIDLPDPPYRAFFESLTPSAVPPEMNIRLTTGRMPDTGGMKKIFDSGQSWSMFVHDDAYCMLSQPAAFEKPVWLALFDQSVENVTIFCSEMLVRENNGVRRISNPVRYPLDQLLLMYYLAPREGMLVHAAAMAIGGKCLVFPGKSGAGKSTLARQLIAEGAAVLTDDRVILRKTGSGFRAYGTPWPGDAGVAVNESRSLAGIFFIRHGSENKICDISRAEALERLMPVTSIPWYDQAAVGKLLGFCENLVSAIPACEIHFKPGTAIGNLLENFIAP